MRVGPATIWRDYDARMDIGTSPSDRQGPGPVSLTLLDWRRRVAAMYRDVRVTAEADPEASLRRFREAIAAVCARHRVPCVDVAAGLEVAGLRRGAGPDGIHLNDSTRRFEAGLLTTAILEAAGPGSLPAPPPAGREPAGAGAQASHF